MSDFITLSCPSCGAKLEITQDVNRFACYHCGREHIVRRSGGIVSLAPVVDAINQVKSGVDRTAAELAIIRLQKEIKGLENQKVNLSNSSPAPSNGGILVACFLGLVVVSCGLIFSSTDSTARGVFLVIAVIGFTIIGIIFTQKNPKRKEIWQRTTGKTLTSLTYQINQKKLELRHFRDMVSSN
jgi:uncharacterized protein (DUF983 family)